MEEKIKRIATENKQPETSDLGQVAIADSSLTTHFAARQSQSHANNSGEVRALALECLV
jgi:hypothetical protein